MASGAAKNEEVFVLREDMTFGFIAGDVGLSTSDAWMSRAIKWFESLWTKDAKRSHVFAFVDEKRIVEALGKICFNRASRYADEDLVIYRIPLTDKEREDFSDGMIKRVNGAYGWLKYPLFMLDAGTTWVKNRLGMKKPCFFFTHTFGISNIPVCSELVVWGLYKFTSYRLLDEEYNVVDWRIVTPDYLEDLLKLPQNKAIKIYEQTKEKK